MAKFISSARKSYEFVSDKLWKIRIDKVDKRQGLLLTQLRVFSLAIKRFHQDNCLVAATALTFYTLFSIVPILALLFAVAKGFGFEKNLQDQILANNSQYSSVLSDAFVYANSMLASAKGGIIAGFGIILLLWSVMKLLISIENSFNQIWEVKRGRSWIRKVTDYLTIMLVGPLFLIVSGGLTVAVQTKLGNIEMLGIVGTFLVKMFAWLLVAVLFMFLFIALPNTKVNRRSAFAAAVVSTVIFELLGWAYVRFQIGANQLNAIYGGFAALPLFLIWVQYSWYIVLFGAELAYSYQHARNYELEEDISHLSQRYKKVIALMIANLVAKRFYNQEKPFTIVEISLHLDLPARLATTIVNEFVETGIFVEVRSEKDETVYQPGITESKFTVKYVIDLLEKKGVNNLPINDTIELIHINKLMQELDHTLDNQLGHVYVKDLVA
jgi:membrane protein